MKKSQVRTITLLLFCCWLGVACKKSHSGFTPSLSFETTNDSSQTSVAIHFPSVTVAVQEVDTLHTTTIFGQYSDTSTLVGGISIHVIGDTTATYKGNGILATYTDGLGNTYNSFGDSTDVVTITAFSKADEGEVTGSFSLTVTGPAGTPTINDGSFIAGFLD